MQSWGTQSHFQMRATDDYPSKSAVIGLIAAALGYRRNEDEKIAILNQLDYAVRVDQVGKRLMDFQTARIRHHRSKTRNQQHPYVTQRYYLSDAVFVVAIGSEDHRLMNKIYEALQYPYFQLFMGRRSYPVPYDFLLDYLSGSVVSVLETYPDQSKTNGLRETTIYADATLLPDLPTSLKRDKVFSFSQKSRQFDYRVIASKPVLLQQHNNRTSHDVFSELGG